MDNEVHSIIQITVVAVVKEGEGEAYFEAKMHRLLLISKTIVVKIARINKLGSRLFWYLWQITGVARWSIAHIVLFFPTAVLPSGRGNVTRDTRARTHSTL